MKTYFLPKDLQPELRKIWGIPILGKKRGVAKKFKGLIQKKKFKKLITVGDYCSLNLPSENMRSIQGSCRRQGSYIKIFDGKIRRKKIKIPLKWRGDFSLNCSNPPSTIQKEVWPIIRKAIKENKNVFVRGEEDLLVIPSVLLSKNNSVVVYGFPGKGICLIEVSPKIKKVFKEILKKFSTKPG